MNSPPFIKKTRQIILLGFFIMMSFGLSACNDDDSSENKPNTPKLNCAP